MTSKGLGSTGSASLETARADRTRAIPARSAGKLAARGAEMDGSLRDVLWELWRRLQSRATERRTVHERERFWAEVREGEREAEVHTRP